VIRVIALFSYDVCNLTGPIPRYFPLILYDQHSEAPPSYPGKEERKALSKVHMLTCSFSEYLE
jgi:hypothetical protein